MSKSNLSHLFGKMQSFRVEERKKETVSITVLVLLPYASDTLNLACEILRFNLHFLFSAEVEHFLKRSMAEFSH